MDALIFGLSLAHDLIYYNEAKEQHKRHLHQVLLLLEQSQFYAKRNKCNVGVHELKYLYHIVSGNGIKLMTDKVETVRSWPAYSKWLHMVV
jgi:hypothetical protein